MRRLLEAESCFEHALKHTAKKQDPIAGLRDLRRRYASVNDLEAVARIDSILGEATAPSGPSFHHTTVERPDEGACRLPTDGRTKRT